MSHMLCSPSSPWRYGMTSNLSCYRMYGEIYTRHWLNIQYTHFITCIRLFFLVLSSSKHCYVSRSREGSSGGSWEVMCHVFGRRKKNKQTNCILFSIRKWQPQWKRRATYRNNLFCLQVCLEHEWMGHIVNVAPLVLCILLAYGPSLPRSTYPLKIDIWCSAHWNKAYFIPFNFHALVHNLIIWINCKSLRARRALNTQWIFGVVDSCPVHTTVSLFYWSASLWPSVPSWCLV